MENTGQARLPGRPKSQEKRDAILESAKAMFLEHGYSQTSMEMVAERAGVGKPTVYSHFGSKERLFDALIARRQEMLAPVLNSLQESTGDPREDLLQFARKFHAMILTAESERWARLIISEASRHPELARKFFQAGPAKASRLIAEYLARQSSAGRLKIDDPRVATEHFMGLMMGLDLIRGLTGNQPRRTAAEVEQRAEVAISAFLRIYGIE